MSIESITIAVGPLADAICKLLNGSFIIAFVGGLTGAIGGALGAQHIVERSQRRKEGLRELRYTNAGIMVSLTICNAAFALKKQHVLPRREAYVKAKSEVEAFKRKREAKEVPSDQELHIEMDLRTFPAPIVPIESLKHMVFQEISVIGRPLALVATIEQSLIGLTAAIAQRDNLVERFNNGSIPENAHANYFFGLPLPGGHLNREYPDLVNAIYSYTDDLAFFSSQLCDDLMKHGEKVRESLVKSSSKRVPAVSKVDFSNLVKSGLMPSETEYRDWTGAFIEGAAK